MHRLGVGLAVTLLYRTPNVRIDEFEFHATVESCRGDRPRQHFRWRRPGGMWRTMTDFEGHPPKAKVLSNAFQQFKHHMKWAEQGEPVNAAGAT